MIGWLRRLFRPAEPPKPEGPRRSITEPPVDMGQGDWGVVLTAAGEDPGAVATVVQGFTGMLREQAEALVDEAPAEIRSGLSRSLAEAFAERLEQVGGKAEVRGGGAREA